MSIKIVVDTREQVPWRFDDIKGIELVRAKLDAGDYSIVGLERRVAIERKSIDDWHGTVLRDRARFYRELEALRAYEFRCVIIESSIRNIIERQYSAQVAPSSSLGFIAEIAVAQSVPVYLGGTRAESQVLAGVLLKAAAKRMLGVTIDGGDAPPAARPS